MKADWIEFGLIEEKIRRDVGSIRQIVDFLVKENNNELYAMQKVGSRRFETRSVCRTVSYLCQIPPVKWMGCLSGVIDKKKPTVHMRVFK